MIYTITFNPSLDYILQLDEFVAGSVNRSESEFLYPGGKGINVSIVFSNLGIESVALGFTAGFTGQKIEQMLHDLGCITDFIRLENGFSRINVKIKAKQESELNGQGPKIDESDIQQLYQKLANLKQGDMLVLAGSIPNTLPANMYERIMERVSKEIPIVVDATNDLLVNVLKFSPFLIKPNNIELGEIFNKSLENREDIITHAKKLQEMGAKNVLVSMAGDGAILVDETGAVHEAKPPKGIVKNSVGAGDSMVAGFITGYLKTGSFASAFEAGVAAGSATAFSPWLATKEDVIALLAQPEKYNF